MNNFEKELNEACAGYNAAKIEINKLKNDAIDKVREVGANSPEVPTILKEMTDEMEMYESDMKYYREQFEGVKSKYIKMISSMTIG